MFPNSHIMTSYTSNFPVGLAPKKKAPGTHHICRKTRGKMLLGVYLWGPFLGGGKPTGKSNYNLTQKTLGTGTPQSRDLLVTLSKGILSTYRYL